MEFQDTYKIALLIDADNASADLVDEVLAELSTVGVINIRRAYGNWTKGALYGWQQRLLEFAIRPMQQFDYSRRKNATDMAMTVDAMELLYTEHPDAYGIVSSDADFTPLVMHLRSKGAAVFGFGAAQTPRPFVNACSRFLYLETLRDRKASLAAEAAGDDLADFASAKSSSHSAQASPQGQKPENEQERGQEQTTGSAIPSEWEKRVEQSATRAARSPGKRVPADALRHNTRLMSRLRSAVRASEDEQGWASVARIGYQIGNVESFDARNFGYGSLTKLLKATEAFEFQGEGTAQVAVRFKG